MNLNSGCSEDDHCEDAIQRTIVEDVPRLDTQHANPLLHQPSISMSIVVYLTGMIVVGTVNLHGEVSRRTEEVEHICADWMLPTKAQTFESAGAKTIPENYLR